MTHQEAQAMAQARQELLKVLETLHPGDQIGISYAASATGLDEETCETVLEALVRVGLFTRGRAGVFVRVPMFDALEHLRN
jgi:hypothetical protein